MPLCMGGEIRLTEVRSFVDHAAILQSQRHKFPQPIVGSRAVHESQRRLLLHWERRENSIDVGAPWIESQDSPATKQKGLPAICVDRAQNVVAAKVGNPRRHAIAIRRKLNTCEFMVCPMLTSRP